MKTDDEGFLIPVINQDSCIDCKLCQNRCPQNVDVHFNQPKNVWAIRDKNDEEIYKSASGGAFAVFASYILKKGGLVFGAAYIDDDLHVGHFKIDNIAELWKLQSSKYVQSDTLHSYKEVKDCLQNNKYVLYSGTPCQIAGLKSFLKKEYDSLLTIDIICHGVPSPLLFEKYIQWLSAKISKIVSYDFRDKTSGWGLDYKAKSKSKSLRLHGTLDPYYYHFLEGNTYRECCYQCNYAKKQRVSDITIGDYWGIEKEHPTFYSTKGVSCILLNTEKGENAFKNISDFLYIQESNFDKVSKHNGNLLHPTVRTYLRDNIYRGINDLELNQFFCENMVYPRPIIPILKAYLPKELKLALKKLRVFFINKK